jgi:hypothetical protein
MQTGMIAPGRDPAQNATDEQHRQIGGRGRREQARGHDGNGHLDHHDLAEDISCRTEERLAQAKRQRNGGGQQDAAPTEVAKSAAMNVMSGSRRRVARAPEKPQSERTRRSMGV